MEEGEFFWWVGGGLVGLWCVLGEVALGQREGGGKGLFGCAFDETFFKGLSSYN
jgi:hypothetical protein